MPEPLDLDAIEQRRYMSAPSRCDAIPALIAECRRLRSIVDDRERYHGSLTSVLIRAGNQAIADRENLGRAVRTAWIEWARTQPDPKPSWLVPYSQLSEPDQEADRQIGEHIARLVGASYAEEITRLRAALRAIANHPPDSKPSVPWTHWADLARDALGQPQEGR